MASLDSLQVRQLMAKGVVVQKASDTSVALRLRYVGTGTVTSVTTVTATSVVTISTAGTGYATEGTKTYLFSAYATMGELADAINADGIFECKVLDVLRSDASDNNLLASALTDTNAIDEMGNATWDIFTDTSAFFQLGVCLSAHRGFDAPKNRRVHLQEIAYVADVGTAAYDNLQIWRRKGSTEIQIWSGLNVDHASTLNTINFASGLGKITSGEDEELIVLVKDAGSLADTAYMRLTGIIE
jgi:hypothetical protein